MKNFKPYSLHLPRWYPIPEKPDWAPFVKAHFLAASKASKAILIFAYPGKSSKRFEKETNDSLEVLIRFQPLSNRILNGIYSLYILNREVRRIQRKHGKPSIIHGHVHTRNLIVARNLAKKFKVPYFVTEHWSGFCNGQFFELPKYKRGIMKSLYEQAQSVLPVSSFLAKGMRSSGILANYTVVPNVIEIPEGVERTNSEKFRFLVISDMRNEVKNIKGILQAFQKAELPGAEIHLVGDGLDKEELMNDFSAPNIHWHSACAHHEVFHYLAGADGLIVFSKTETFSMISLEAIGMGVPVISSPCGGPEEWIDSETGILLKSFEVDELVSAMEQLQSNPIHIPERVRKEKLAPFGLEKVSETLHKLYEPWLS